MMWYLSFAFGAVGFIFGGWKGAAIGFLTPIVLLVGGIALAVWGIK